MTATELAELKDNGPTTPAGAPVRSGALAARIENVSKSFGQRRVLSNVSFTVAPGQVHALIGANGAGKSSMVKILAGYYDRDDGNLFIGEVAAPRHTNVAQMTQLGVRVVHQDLGLVDGLSVLENVAAGRAYVKGRFGRIDWRSTSKASSPSSKSVWKAEQQPSR